MNVRRVMAVVLLGLFGLLILPFEQRISAEAQLAHLQQTSLDLSLRERVGQMGFLAALSGFRSALAAIIRLEACAAWERTEWAKVAALYDTVTILQPRSVTYWCEAASQMADNAAVAALQNPRQSSERLRNRDAMRYLNIARDFLERGIRNNPDSYKLYAELGNLLRDKFHDPAGAAAAYLQGSDKPNALPFLKRFAGYELAKCPGREREAYTLLKRLYDQGPNQRLPTLIRTLQDLEKNLDIPPSQRVKSHPEK